MSILNNFHTNDANVSRLVMAVNGPLITVEISIPTVLVSVFESENKKIPDPKVGLVLIDSGAHTTSFDDSLIRSLEVSPTGIANVLTPNGASRQNTYPVHLRVPSHNIDIDLPQVIGADLKDQRTTTGEPIIGLLGRDFLASCIFIYNGVGGLYTLAT